MKKRSHSVPRFLLDNFKSRASGSTRWVWQYRLGSDPLEISTKDAGVRSGIYGKDDYLEDLLASMETKTAPILRRIEKGDNPNQYSKDLWSFVFALCFRTSSFREHALTALKKALLRFAESIRAEAASKALLEGALAQARNRLNEMIQGLPEPKRKEAADWLSHQDVAALLHQVGPRHLTTSEIGNWAADLIRDQVLSSSFNPDFQDASINALVKVMLTNGPRVAVRTGAMWNVLSSTADVIIGDCGAVVVGSDDSVGHFLRFGGDEWREIYVPISPHSVLVASRCKDQTFKIAEEVNEVSASLSRHCFWASSPHLSKLAERIGARSPLATDGEIDKMVSEYWNEWLGNDGTEVK